MKRIPTYLLISAFLLLFSSFADGQKLKKFRDVKVRYTQYPLQPLSKQQEKYSYDLKIDLRGRTNIPQMDVFLSKKMKNYPDLNFVAYGGDFTVVVFHGGFSGLKTDLKYNEKKQHYRWEIKYQFPLTIQIINREGEILYNPDEYGMNNEKNLYFGGKYKTTAEANKKWREGKKKAILRQEENDLKSKIQTVLSFIETNFATIEKTQKIGFECPKDEKYLDEFGTPWSAVKEGFELWNAGQTAPAIQQIDQGINQWKMLIEKYEDSGKTKNAAYAAAFNCAKAYTWSKRYTQAEEMLEEAVHLSKKGKLRGGTKRLHKKIQDLKARKEANLGRVSPVVSVPVVVTAAPQISINNISPANFSLDKKVYVTDQNFIALSFSVNHNDGLETVVYLNDIEVFDLDQKGNDYTCQLNIDRKQNQVKIVVFDQEGNALQELEDEIHLEVKTYVRQGEDHALFIAVQDYTDPSLVDLDSPFNDVEMIANRLQTDFGFKTKMIKNPQSPQDLKTQLVSYMNQVGETEDSQLLIYFSGHGILANNSGYFATAQTKVNNSSTAISYGELRDIIDNANCQHIMVMIDACYSGAFFPKMRGDFIDGDLEKVNVSDFPAKRKYLTRRAISATNKKKKIADSYKNLTNSKFALTFSSVLEKQKSFTHTTLEALIKSNLKNYEPISNEFGSNDKESDFFFFAK